MGVDGRNASRRVRDSEEKEVITSAIMIIEAFVREKGWPERLQGAKLLVDKQIEGLGKGVRDLAKGYNGSKPLTCAEVVRTKGSPGKEMPVPARRTREVVIVPRKSQGTRKTSAEVVRDVDTALKENVVTASRTLPSGNTVITFDKSASKEKWAKTQVLAEGVGQTLEFVREYTVLLHGIRVATVDTRDQGKAKEEIYAQNRGLEGKVEIVRVAWPKKTIKDGKRIAPLHIGMAEPEQANILIDQGLLYGSELHDCEVFYNIF
ncbi:hypothetical protein BJ878DRAFT_559605 [Calycina marina]|uniref:Uncharacterized protein n=1 Tax=Calycina marina TaxID=1763456 RepID=A0A9P7YW43_9HELO|nr:hypothetical protein BJ878DRAFT_559605 [Calycina marina]